MRAKMADLDVPARSASAGPGRHRQAPAGACPRKYRSAASRTSIAAAARSARSGNT